MKIFSENILGTNCVVYIYVYLYYQNFYSINKMEEGNNLDKSKKCCRGNKPNIYISLTRMSNISIKKGDGVKTKTKIGI